MSKIPKLTDMFRKQQCQSDTGIAEAAGTETSDMEASVHGVPHPEPEANHETGANVGAVSATTSRTNEQGDEEQSVHYCNDLGMWADDMSTEMRDWWIGTILSRKS